MKIITIGGMIGVGKTTKIDDMILADKVHGIKSKAVYELYETKEGTIFPEKTTRDEIMTILLDMYYAHLDCPDRMAKLMVTFMHQSNFLIMRTIKTIEAIKIAEEEGLEKLYLDRTIFEDIVFTKENLFHEPLFWELYHSCWKMAFNYMRQALKGHDVVNIILTAPTEVILERIKKRGREIEQGNDQYFINLNEKYVEEMKANFTLEGWDYEVHENYE